MDDKKTDTSESPAPEVPNSVSDDCILPADEPVCQAVPAGNPADSGSGSNNKGKDDRFKGSRRCSCLKSYSATRTLAAKFYEEQMPLGIDYVINQIKSFDPKKVQILFIIHDKDEVGDDIWVPSIEKRHGHLIARAVTDGDRFGVIGFLKALGIHYRPGLDDKLWKNNGVETVGNFAGYALYLTHETEEAIRDAKHKYDITEIHSNLTIEEIKQVREGYIRVSEKRKVTMDELVALDKEAYDYGYNLKDYEDFYNCQPFSVRSNPHMKTVRENYEAGLADRVKELNSELFPRCCIFITGDSNTGKTYAAIRAIESMGLTYIKPAEGSGKFDKLRPSTGAIVIDDSTCPNLLNMSDDHVCYAYKRGQGSPAWCGKYLIVTSNLEFEEWLGQCGISKNEHISACYTRFIICHIEENSIGRKHLVIDKADLRGDGTMLKKKYEMYINFQSRFDDVIGDYFKSQSESPFNQIVGKMLMSEEEEEICVAAETALKNEYKGFCALWLKVNEAEIDAGKKRPESVFTYEDWLKNGMDNAYDFKKHKWYRE